MADERLRTHYLLRIRLAFYQLRHWSHITSVCMFVNYFQVIVCFSIQNFLFTFFWPTLLATNFARIFGFRQKYCIIRFIIFSRIIWAYNCQPIQKFYDRHFLSKRVIMRLCKVVYVMSLMLLLKLYPSSSLDLNKTGQVLELALLVRFPVKANWATAAA